MSNDNERPFLLFDLQPGQRSLKGLWLLVGYYVFSILFGACLAAPLYWFVQWSTAHIVPLTEGWVWLHENCVQLTNYLLGKSLDNYFERARMVPLLLGLPWIMWMCRLLSFRALGVDFTRQNMRRAGLWWLVGAAMLGAVAWGQIEFGNAYLKEGTQPVAFKLFTAFSGAAIIALLEEIVFRGIVLRIFYSAFGGVWAVILSSAFYAYTHFKVPGALVSTVAGDTEFMTGFGVGFWTLFGIVKGFSLMEFLVLFGLGSAIGQVFLKTRTLLPGMGLHAGLVFTMLFYQAYYEIAYPTALWGSVNFKNGWVPLVIIALLNLAVFAYYRRKEAREMSDKPVLKAKP